MTGALLDADLLDLLHESIFVRDLDGRIRLWNAACEELYGWDAAQAVGRNAHELLGSQHHAELVELEESLLVEGRWEGEATRRTARGDTVIVDVRWSLKRDDRGNPIEIIEAGRDVTARRGAEEAFRQSEYKYRNLFQAMAASFWELDFAGVGHMLRALRADGVTDLRRHFAEHPEYVRAMMRATRVLDVNEQTVALFGRGAKSDLLTDLEPYWPEASNHVFAESVIAAVGRQPHYVTETRLRSLDGREFDALFTACFPSESVAKGMLLIGVIDISARLRAQEALQRVQADFARAARIATLGELTASIAHEVNQPLAAITTNAEAGLRWLARPEPDLEEVRALNARMVADARRAADIISRIRAIATQGTPQRTPIDINGVVEETLLFLRHELQAQGVAVTVELASDLPEPTGDRTQLQQVLVNLIVNAMQAMAPTPAVDRKIMLRSWSEAGAILVSVTDAGPGFEVDHAGSLFSSFFTTKAGGMGIGLAVCRSIIEAHGGRITAENMPGGGARFVFSLAPDETA